jgi:serine/threonine protein kinase
MNDPNPKAPQIFADALAMTDPVARRDYLELVCAANGALREEVESLLQAHEQAGNFLREAALEPPTGVVAERTGTMIGRYKLLEKIGEGGFGVVWMAGQEEPVRRRVALKIIKAGMDTRQVLARFEAERQALAMMEHPNIARVFDGGATDTGRPYFVMELVKGIPITTYCDANKLSTRDRLALFIQVCQAVQHAHQKGVIHRDLKPSNILVTEQDGAPVPKVIDFGVAKATQARLTERTLFTGLHQMIGTPTYMSPEQAGLGALDIDTRSDIYALGALLYELLTGRTPFTKEEFEKAGLDEIFRLIREQEPPKPSTRLSTLTHEELTTISTRRQSEPAKLNKLLRGDLDWVVMKAMEKDRRRRYETPDALANDLVRHVNNQPVTARPPSTTYLLGKYLRRHRLPIAASCTAIITLSLAAVIAYLLVFPSGNGPVYRPQKWEVLFDGTSTAAFRGYQQTFFPSNDWIITAQGELTTVPGSTRGHIVTKNQYDDFELVWEWKLSPGANSGVHYRMTEEFDEPRKSGPEYQLLDDRAFPSLPPDQACGGVFALIPPTSHPAMPAGEWNQSRLLVQGNHVEHWLNGRKVVAYEIDSPAFRALIAAIPYNRASTNQLALARKSCISFQNWIPEVWFRNIKIRPLVLK